MPTKEKSHKMLRKQKSGEKNAAAKKGFNN